IRASPRAQPRARAPPQAADAPPRAEQARRGGREAGPDVGPAVALPQRRPRQSRARARARQADARQACEHQRTRTEAGNVPRALPTRMNDPRTEAMHLVADLLKQAERKALSAEACLQMVEQVQFVPGLLKRVAHALSAQRSAASVEALLGLAPNIPGV